MSNSGQPPPREGQGVRYQLSRMPAFAWLPAYRFRKDFSSDAIAGITVAVMLIPQGMAYAMLAGLPPVVGLYASLLPLVAYALVGSSRQLAVGPVAMDSLLVATGAALVAAPGSPEFLMAAIVLAGMTGVLQLLMGGLRLGFLVNFLSRPVISGFTSAAAIVIGLSQLKHILGVDLPRSSTLHGWLSGALPQLQQTHLATLLIGVVGVGVIVALKKLAPRVPAALVVVLAGTSVSWFWGLDSQGVGVVGTVPSGLPTFQYTTLSWAKMEVLAPTALMIALIGFMEAVSVAKSLASKHAYDVHSNQELLGLGAANLAAFFTGGYPVTGGFSRSAVNDQAGARSPLASLITVAVIALSLVAFTPLFYYLPKAILGSIVLVAVFGLIDVPQVRHLWRVRRSDAALLVVTFAATLFIGIAQGIVVGVTASLAVFIQRTTRPHTAELGRLPGTDVFRNILNFPEARTVDGVLILRMDASFYFANVAFFRDRLESFLRHAPPGVDTVLIDASSINDLDSSAEAALKETVLKLRAAGKDLFFANIKGPVRRVMQRSGLWHAVGDDHIYLDLARAVEAIEALRSEGALHH